jgi:hypothetical protein
MSNYESHLRGLPNSAMPRTFADAIEVVRFMGYQYIWIDAFCIIQDDSDDLQRELPRMGDIYRYADFTIYTAGAANSHAGAFLPRDPQKYRPCSLSIKINTSHGDIVQDITLATTHYGPDYLDPRGWVLQERILSSRCLIFGQQMAWSCSEAEAQETNPVMRRTRLNKLVFSPASFRSLIYQNPQAAIKIRTPAPVAFRSWYNLVEHYSDKELAQSSDNLNAVSGLAALCHETFGFTYLAGLWKEHLHAGLAWYVASNDERATVQDIQEPSWSWSSVGKVRLSYRKWQGTLEIPNLTNAAQIVNTFCEFANPSNPYGSLPKGIISLRTYLKQGRLHHSHTYAVSRIALSYGGQVNRQAIFGMEVADQRERPRYPAFITDIDNGKPVADVALDMQIEQQALPDGSGESVDTISNVWCALLHVERCRQASYATLLVIKQVESNRFRRIGLGFVSDSAFDWVLSSQGTEIVSLV